jgi:lipopolysaccharide/colanic/teichoic acid biosynthesis glycosyltransferase
MNFRASSMSYAVKCPYTSRRDLFEKHFLPLLNVKPGMTGWSQITEAREGFGTTEQRVNDDLHYVENWSLFLDVKIILMIAFSQQPNASTDR